MGDAARFRFGDNWESFLFVVSEERIAQAQDSLKRALRREDLSGMTFLDAGCGSRLFSLAARRLGARVHSFDYDEMSVACARKLKERYLPADEGWIIERGDVCDRGYLAKLGLFDVVYSWGVLHHTGAMWQALENVLMNVSEDGCLYISIYNDQGVASLIWKKVKRFYCSGPLGRWVVLGVFVPLFAVKGFLKDIVFLKNPLRRYSEYKKNRGMSVIHDWIDWLGGYPFEVAKPQEITRFYEAKGLHILYMKTCGRRLGCNEFVFARQKG